MDDKSIRLVDFINIMLEKNWDSEIIRDKILSYHEKDQS